MHRREASRNVERVVPRGAEPQGAAAQLDAYRRAHDQRSQQQVHRECRTKAREGTLRAAERAELVAQLGTQTRLFLLSNTNAIHAAEFEQDLARTLPDASRFWGAFEVAHYSHDLGVKKPDPATFLHVCGLHGLNPAKTLFLDDSIQHVRGAEEAGLVAHHLDLSQGDFASWMAQMGWR